MDQRLRLHDLLKGVTGNVYFQPPSNVKMQYPCIVYRRSGDDTKWADDRRYSHRMRYEVTVIDLNPDGTLLEKMFELPLCKFERHFTADNLNHDVFNLFF